MRESVSGFVTSGGNGERHTVARDYADNSLLEIADLESLLLNMDASLNVHERMHFFGWTQGLFQGLVPHSALICALRATTSTAFRLDGFSTLVPDAGRLGKMLQSDAATIPSLITLWADQGFNPVIRTVDEIGMLLGGPFVREIKRIGATHLSLHGSPSIDRDANGFYIFARAPRDVIRKEAYILELAVPFLHAAWMRAQTAGAPHHAPKSAAPAAVLTEREREILKWVYNGKSNGEVGAILAISPLTVKNHVQKILRKLNVVNRAQAVGKALESRLIGP
ncbi:MAG TPA: XrtB/PEP-CTERM-associated transcriptional regulator EpsA [Gammaproteobacteria bacterium]|nr:XrtB/PEP-CTERM-associated transcriptional regulator EpsA [Gammaproteobacteria bacterium]